MSQKFDELLMRSAPEDIEKHGVKLTRENGEIVGRRNGQKVSKPLKLYGGRLCGSRRYPPLKGTDAGK